MLRYIAVFLAIFGLLLTAAFTAPGFGLKRELAQKDMKTGDNWRDRHDYRRAIRAYSRAIDTNELDPPDLARAYFLRAESRRNLVYMTGPDDAALIEALNDINKAIEIQDDKPGYLQSRARIYSFLGAYSEASSDLETAVRLEKDKPFWTLIQKGVLQRTLGDYKGSLETFRSVPEVRKNKRSMPPRYHMALTFMDQQNYGDAVTVLNEGIKAESDHFGAWLEKGCAKANLGRYAEALADYRKGAELFDDADHYDPPYPAREHDDRIHREELKFLQDIAEKRIDPDKERIRSLCTRFWFRLHFDVKRERSPLLPA